MDDLQSTISQIMSDPEALKQVQSLGEKLGLSGNSNNVSIPEEPPRLPELPQNDMTSLLGNDTFLGNDALSSITRIMPILNMVKQEDETTQLLMALRPFLSEDKRKKLDDAKRMLQFLKVLPLLKNGGLF